MYQFICSASDTAPTSKVHRRTALYRISKTPKHTFTSKFTRVFQVSTPSLILVSNLPGRSTVSSLSQISPRWPVTRRRLSIPTWWKTLKAAYQATRKTELGKGRKWGCLTRLSNENENPGDFGTNMCEKEAGDFLFFKISPFFLTPVTWSILDPNRLILRYNFSY